MNGYDPGRPPLSLHPAPRLWRHDGGAMFAGVCAGLAEDLDLPLPLVRLVSVLFLVLPTGFAYLALGVLLRRRPAVASGLVSRSGSRRDVPAPAAAPFRTATGPAPLPPHQDWALLRHRFAALEPRINRIEGVVTAEDFELHRDFRRMEP